MSGYTVHPQPPMHDMTHRVPPADHSRLPRRFAQSHHGSGTRKWESCLALESVIPTGVRAATRSENFAHHRKKRSHVKNTPPLISSHYHCEQTDPLCRGRRSSNQPSNTDRATASKKQRGNNNEKRVYPTWADYLPFGHTYRPKEVEAEDGKIGWELLCERPTG